MGGQLIEGVTRKQVFMVPTERALIAGVDFGKEDPFYEDFYDPRAVTLPLVPETIASIKTFGVREPCEVVVLDDGRIIVSDGRRRNLHLRAANKELVKAGEPAKFLPCVAIKGTTDAIKSALLIGEMLNNHRVQDSVMVKAEKAVRMMDQRGYTREQVALSLNVSPVTVDDYYKIVGLAKPLRDMIDAGTLSPTAGAKLSGLSKDEQVVQGEKLLAESGGKKVTVRAATGAAKGVKNGSNETVVAPTKRQLRKAIENGKGILSEEVILALRIAIGDLPPSKMKGLTKLLRGDDGAAE